MDDTAKNTDPAALRRWTGRTLMAVIFGLAIWNLIVSLMENVITPWLGTLMGQNTALPASFTRNYDYPDLLVAVIEFCLAGIVALSVNWFLVRPRKAIPAKAPSTYQAVQSTITRSQYWQPASIPEPVAAGVAPVAPAQSSSAPAVASNAARSVDAPTVPSNPEPTVAKPAEIAKAARQQESPHVAAPITTRPASAPTPPTAAQRVTAPLPRVSAIFPSAPAPTAQISPNSEPKPKPAKEKQVYYNIVGEPVSFDED